MLFAAGSVLATLVGGTPYVSGGALGAALGILGYFLGSRRLATVTAVVGMVAIFFALAASQGLIPGIQPFDGELPGPDA
jgi:VIT1/CCC1 family predicted Fe2+/Mn2+ transporter